MDEPVEKRNLYLFRSTKFSGVMKHFVPQLSSCRGRSRRIGYRTYSGLIAPANGQVAPINSQSVSDSKSQLCA